MRDSITDREVENLFFLLYRLAEMGAVNRTLKISTKFLAEKMDLSQQTLSRRLIDLERKGLVLRSVARDGTYVKISDQGVRLLRKIQSGLNIIFEEHVPLSVTLEGLVFSGLGEGAYYVTRKPYRDQFIQKLGFDPYPGTLNLKLVDDYNRRLRRELETCAGIEIEGFQNENRTFGPVKCFQAKIGNKEDGAVLFALRTHYDDSVLEIISPYCLRSRLRLKDGSKLKVEVFIKSKI
ncbi:MAG: DUF120 domain-containing protein [Nitrososphaerota archaeon]|nr:CTP-dependent riboflavin kinase [Candidatus Bathyarchaeota archaeon]MDW8048620.1 DUF120 domain-containing protein [Nitrososphaerota archaeon]